jgi:hypothetical protein
MRKTPDPKQGTDTSFCTTTVRAHRPVFAKCLIFKHVSKLARYLLLEFQRNKRYPKNQEHQQ